LAPEVENEGLLTRSTGFFGGHTVRVHLYALTSYTSFPAILTYSLTDGYKHGGVGIHLWNVTMDLLASFKMVSIVTKVSFI
jgi:hypothetical protein